MRYDDGVAFAFADGSLNPFVISQTSIIIDSFHGVMGRDEKKTIAVASAPSTSHLFFRGPALRVGV